MERANGDTKDMLVAWLFDNYSKHWTTGIKFVQFHKNSAHHSGIKCSPYSAMFRNEAGNAEEEEEMRLELYLHLHHSKMN